MGQYHTPVNFTKKEYISPHKLGTGLKLCEQIAQQYGTGSALLVLLACSNGRGGGDLREHPTEDVVGRWAGDVVIMVGDYAEEDDVLSVDVTDFHMNEDQYTDVSELVCQILESELQIQYADGGWRNIFDMTSGNKIKHATSMDFVVSSKGVQSNVRDK